jgi:DNA-binding response OmpR family regulator
MITMHKPTPAGFSDSLPRKTILVVDDDAAVRKGLRGVLVSEGYQVIVARHGREAVQVFREHPCDLALLDMNMPLRNGWGTIADLRALKSQLPAIIITARPDQRNVAREAGVELMEKPLDLPLLLYRIGALLSEPQDGAPALPSASLPS